MVWCKSIHFWWRYAWKMIFTFSFPVTLPMLMSTWIYIVQFHAKRLNCALCTSISRTRLTSMCTNNTQSVHAVWQAVNSRRRRPADRVCYVNTTERSSGSGWLIVDVDCQHQRLEYSSWPDTLVLCSPDTDGPWQPSCTPCILWISADRPRSYLQV